MRISILYFSTLAIASICLFDDSAVAAPPTQPHVPSGGRKDLVLESLRRGYPHEPSELLLQFKSKLSSKDKERARGRVGASVKEIVVPGEGGADLELVKIAPGKDLATAVLELHQDQAVDFAEPNWNYSHQGASFSNDTLFTNGSLWGMYGAASSPANAFGSGAADAWFVNADCSSVVVGIIDEGYMYSHPDLAANVFKNPGEIAGNKKDDDGNGYIDDVYGWDFANNDATVFDGVGDDHGTHVAGTIGGVGGNSLGVAGVCWSVKLLSAKFLGSRGGTTANAIKASDYLTDLKKRHGLNLVATNNSWGGGGYSQSLADAIARAGSASILFVAAAGNNGTNIDSSPSYPAAYGAENIISVAAIDSSGGLASFSNYGATQVDLGAPGVNIYSTVPVSKSGKVVASYASYSGTSMATPHVTGAAALYRASFPASSASEIKAALLSGKATASLAGKTVTGTRLFIGGWIY